MLPPSWDWMAHLRRMSGKSVFASTSITPQAWLAWSPAMVQPIEARTLLRAPSAPTTYFARTAAAVSAEGGTLAEVITDLDSHYSGLGDRLIKNGALHRFVNIYVNDEDVRFTGGLETTVAEGDNVTILPAVAGGAVPGAGV